MKIYVVDSVVVLFFTMIRMMTLHAQRSSVCHQISVMLNFRLGIRFRVIVTSRRHERESRNRQPRQSRANARLAHRSGRTAATATEDRSNKGRQCFLGVSSTHDNIIVRSLNESPGLWTEREGTHHGRPSLLVGRPPLNPRQFSTGGPASKPFA